MGASIQPISCCSGFCVALLVGGAVLTVAFEAEAELELTAMVTGIVLIVAWCVNMIGVARGIRNWKQGSEQIAEDNRQREAWMRGEGPKPDYLRRAEEIHEREFGQQQQQQEQAQ